MGVVDARRSGVWKRIARRAAAAGTAYLLLSLLPLCFLLAAGLGWPTERSTVISVTLHDGREVHGFGLTYQGFGGGLLLWGELLFVVAALILSCRGDRIARIAHAGLIAWAVLLAASFWWVIVASGFLALGWMLPIVTLGAGLVVARWLQARGPRAPAGRRALQD
jgi:hypothetical protein